MKNLDERLRSMRPRDWPLLAIGWVILFVFIMLLPGKAVASDENGERLCLAQNIYFESGNQPLAGRMAVALVTLNRVADEQFPSTICDVVYQARWGVNWKGNQMPIRNQCQFSWFCDGKSDEPKDSKTWLESILIADRILQTETYDFTDGALWYHANWADPYWNDHLREVVIIEDHTFYK